MLYKAKARTVEAVQYDGTNKREIDHLVPPDKATFESAYRSVELIMRRVSPPTDWAMVVHIGDWVSFDGEHAGLHSDTAFRAIFEPASG
jgi:hypothetical protein